MSDVATSPRVRWDALPPAVRALVGALGMLVALVAVIRVADESLTREQPDGPRSSSYATAEQGLAAYADVLRRFGHDVDRVRGAVAAADLSELDTVMVLDPTVLDADATAHLLAYVSGGGRLVIGGDDPGRYLPRLRREPPTWTPGGPDHYRVFAPDADDGRFSSLDDVRTAARGRFTAPGTSTPVLAATSGSGALVATEPVGDGTMVFLADVSPLVNERLATADNAALGVVLAGADGARVGFMEGVHGFGESTGLAALPTRWQRALLLLGIAAALALWARGRRLGPPEDRARPLPPARADYVGALAATLRRTGRAAAAGEVLRREVERTLRARGLLGGEQTAEPIDAMALSRALETAGLRDEERRAVLAGVRDDAGLLAAGAALARVSRGPGPDHDPEHRSRS